MFEKPENLPKVFGKMPKRRIIISTIVAETGLTVDTLKYVIDCGWNRGVEIYQPYGIGGLITRPAPRSKIEQRKGRVGRMFPGEFYPLYTENVFKSLEYQQLPEIISVGIKEKFLIIIREQQKQKVLTNVMPEFKTKDILLLDLPSVEDFIMSNSTANLLGFVSFNSILPNEWPPVVDKYVLNVKYGCGLTELGFIASQFGNLSMEAIRTILMGYVYNCACEDLLNIICIMGINKSDFFTKKETKIKAKKVLEMSIKELFYNKIEVIELKKMMKDEILEMLLIFEYLLQKLSELNSPVKLFTFCEEHGINFETFITIITKRDEVIEELFTIGINPFRLNNNKLVNSILNSNSNSKTILNIKKCIFDGYKNNILKYNIESDSYFTNQKLKVKVSTSLFTEFELKLVDLIPSNLIPEIDLITELNITSNLLKSKKPQYILTDLIKLVAVPSLNPETPAPLLYTIQANMISFK